MEAYQHLIISAAASPLIAYLIFPGEPATLILLWAGIATASGTLIDLDHFVISRLNTGSWDRLHYALKNPSNAFTDGKATMQETISSRQRYSTHVFLALAAATSVYLISGPRYALLILSLMILHIACDLYVSLKKFSGG